MSLKNGIIIAVIVIIVYFFFLKGKEKEIAAEMKNDGTAIA